MGDRARGSPLLRDDNPELTPGNRSGSGRVSMRSSAARARQNMHPIRQDAGDEHSLHADRDRHVHAMPRFEVVLDPDAQSEAPGL
ncbi:hypothetical protein JCM9957A_31010 [Kineosporia succinea]